MIDPRGVLREFGVCFSTFPNGWKCACGTATAELRLPGPCPEASIVAGSEKLSEDELAALVTRDAMVWRRQGYAAAAGDAPMNGVHDMGGMQGMGPIQYEKNEPVFHAAWEGRTLALTLAVSAWLKWNIDAGRHQIELIPAAEYLRMSYYEKWYARLVEMLAKTGLVTRAELESGKPAPDSPKNPTRL